MKFKDLYKLSAFFLLGCSIGGASFVFLYKNTGKNEDFDIKYNIVQIKTDTVFVTDEQVANKKIFAAGVFIPNKNTIKISYFVTKSTNPETMIFCKAANRQIPFVKRHELEHARKANLTKNTYFFTPENRARIAAQNEIIAPAAEIIEAIDMKYRTRLYPSGMRQYAKKAYKEILESAKKQNMSMPIDFNNQEIADITIKNALNAFLASTKRGIYKKTIKKAFQNPPKTFKYQTNNLCNPFQGYYFEPQNQKWEPLWQFESSHGKVNLWKAASDKQKQILLNSIDSLITEITGKQR